MSDDRALAAERETGTTFDLSACVREPIHRLGGIQSHGALIAVGDDDRIGVASANAPEMLGLSIGDRLDPDHLTTLRELATLPSVAERVALTYYTAIGAKALARQKAVHVAKLTAALGDDAPSDDDFTVQLPAKPGPKLGVRIETLLVRTHVAALASTTDGSTRLLLARLLAVDAQHLTFARAAAGLPPATGLPVPLDLEAAGEELDALLKAPNYPTT